MHKIVCPIQLQAEKNPENIAIETNKITISYKKLHQSISNYSENIQYSEKPIAFKAHCEVNTIIFIFACIRKKQVIFPINPNFSEEYTQKLLEEASISRLTDILDINSSPNMTSKKTTELLSKDQLCTIIATSGSSGKPKCAVHTLQNHIASATASQAIIPLTDSDSWLLSLPLYHVSGLSILFRCFLAGAKVLLSEKKQFTHVSMVPYQLQKAIQNEQSRLHHAKVCLVGGGPIQKELLKHPFKKVIIYQTYGLTEMSSQVITNNIPLKSGSVIIKKDKSIWVKGETLFQGYLENGVIRKYTDKDGYFNTGDMGQYKNETIEIIGRKDRMFISGGENIHPEEIEHITLEIPYIQRAIVVGIDDTEFGTVPYLFIKTAQFYTAIEDIRKHLSRLPKYKQPVKIYEIPKFFEEEKVSYSKLSEHTKQIIFKKNKKS
jgi:O-succinylbenzoic acid--CoA ligase